VAAHVDPGAIQCDSGGQVLKQLNRCALGATLLGTFDNGRVEAFIDHAVTLSHTDLQQRHLRLAVARRLRAVHDCQIEPRPQPPTLWASLERNLQTAESLTFESPAQQQLLQQVRE